MPNSNDKLSIQKRIAGSLLRTASRDIREAKSNFVAEETMKVAGRYLRALPGILDHLMDGAESPADAAARLRQEENVRKAAEELQQLRERGEPMH